MNNPDMISDQQTFQLTFGHGVLPYPQIPNQHVQDRRRMLVTEEFNEFLNAWEACNNLSRLPTNDPSCKELEPEALAALADAIVDSIYVLIGTALEYGLPLAAVWKAVQAANMAKLWTAEKLYAIPRGEGFTSFTSGEVDFGHRIDRRFVVHDRSGKVRKPPNWQPPDIVAIIKEAILEGSPLYQSGKRAAEKVDEAVLEVLETPPDQQANRDKWNQALAKTKEANPSQADDDYARPYHSDESGIP